MRKICFSVSSLFVAFHFFSTAQRSDAVSIRYPATISPSDYVTEQPYTFSFSGNYKGKVYTTRLTSLPTGGTPKLKELLAEYADAGWSYNSGQSSLGGDFIIDQYAACGPLQLCGGGSFDLVGVNFSMRYVAANGDPEPINGINWVQRVVSNHPIGGGGHGSREDTMDGDVYLPFYKNSYSTISSVFNDAPARNDPYASHFWIGELFLVQPLGSPSEKRFTIYDGIKWGWGNSVNREKEKYCPANMTVTASSGCATQTAMLGNSAPLSVNKVPTPRPPCPAGMPPSSCVAFGYNKIDSDEIITSELSFDEVADTTAVPTPALLPGLIATGIYHGRKWRKRKHQNQTDNNNDIAA